ncbi:hypothetical protein ACQPZJ_04875 [Actinoplanes sp. CA-054009]
MPAEGDRELVGQRSRLDDRVDRGDIALVIGLGGEVGAALAEGRAVGRAERQVAGLRRKVEEALVAARVNALDQREVAGEGGQADRILLVVSDGGGEAPEAGPAIADA